jgi:hypothetical protein
MSGIAAGRPGQIALLPIGVVAGIALVAGTYVYGHEVGRRERPESTITNDVIVDRIRQVSQLVATKAYVQDIVRYDNTREHLGGIFKSQKVILVVIRGHVNMGIDLSALSPTFDATTKKARVTVPHATMLDAALDTVPRYYDVKKSLFNPFSEADAVKIHSAVDSALQAVGAQKLLVQQADSNVSKALRALVGGYGYELTVDFRQ